MYYAVVMVYKYNVIILCCIHYISKNKLDLQKKKNS